MLNKNGYVSKETVCAEIARFKGYLDEDMIYRLQLAIKRLPDEDLDEKGLLYRLPAPLGSTVYSVHDRCRAPYWDCPFTGGFGTSRCGTKEHCESYYEPIELCLGDLNYIGVTIFLTEEEAKESVERNNAK